TLIPSWIFSLINCSNRSAPPTSPPDILRCFVSHGEKRICSSDLNSSTNKSTIFSAIFRYPVNFPPAIVINPDSDSQISSLREISDGPFPSSQINGRTPAQFDSTSSLTTRTSGNI